jgi:hypothetical protein
MKENAKHTITPPLSHTHTHNVCVRVSVMSISMPMSLSNLLTHLTRYLVEGGVLGVRRCKKKDLNRIARATGGVLLPNLADLEGEESVDPTNLGEADAVVEERVGDGACVSVG